MTLAQLKSMVNKRSDYAHQDSVFEALNSAAQFIFHWVLKESRMKAFIKWDTSTVAFVAGTEEYTMPADVETLFRMRERRTAADDWLLMLPEGLGDPAMLAGQNAFADNFFDDPLSPLGYFGPYLDAAAAITVAQAYKFRVGPIPREARLCELVYAARFVEITNDNSPVMLPRMAHDCLADFASAEILDNDDESRAEKYRTRGNTKLQLFLTVQRRLEQQGTPMQEPFDP